MSQISAVQEMAHGKQENTFSIDNQVISFTPGQTIMNAAEQAGVYIPHLCYHEGFAVHGSCRLCTVKVNGRMTAACNTPAVADMKVKNNTPELQELRRTLIQLLFIEGNHICPGCPKTGNCQLQAVAYYVGMLSPHFEHFYPYRELDASHPEYIMDFNRCILCELCVRASRDIDGKNVFAMNGRGIKSHLSMNAASGKLGDTDFAVGDRAAFICPVGAILRKRPRYTTPIGERLYDKMPISVVGDADQLHAGAKKRHGQ
jgi:[NiFe] hydrogenase diaphorase moiety small subunit